MCTVPFIEPLFCKPSQLHLTPVLHRQHQLCTGAAGQRLTAGPGCKSLPSCSGTSGYTALDTVRSPHGQSLMHSWEQLMLQGATLDQWALMSVRKCFHSLPRAAVNVSDGPAGLARQTPRAVASPSKTTFHGWPSILPCFALPTPHSCSLGSASQINLRKASVSGSAFREPSLRQPCNTHGWGTIILSVPKGRKLGLGKADRLPRPYR